MALLSSYVAAAMAVLAATWAAQQPAPQPATQPPQQSSVPERPFPSDRAKHTIRGKARAAAWFTETRRSADGQRNLVPGCDPVRLTLAGTSIYVRPKHVRWTFPANDRAIALRVTEEGHIQPTTATATLGQRVEVELPQTQSDLEFKIRGTMCSSALRRFAPAAGPWTQSFVLVRSAPGKDIPRPGLDACVCPVAVPDVLTITLPATVPGPLDGARSATVHIFETPLHAVTDEFGYFALPKLPDGEYEVVAKHDRLDTVTKMVTVAGRDPQPITFAFEPPEQLRARSKE